MEQGGFIIQKTIENEFISIAGEYAELPASIALHFFNGNFYQAFISLDEGTTESDYKRIVDTIKRQYGKPDASVPDENINVWLFDGGFTISTSITPSSWIFLRFEDSRASAKRRGR